MPIWIAIPFLLIELLGCIALGYLIVKFWFYVLFGLTCLLIEYTLLISALSIGRNIFISGGIT